MMLLITLSFRMEMMSGPISGDLTDSPQNRLTNTLVGTCLVMWSSKNCGRPPAKTTTSFFLLLLKDRLSTRELLKRRNMELPSYNCVLCSEEAEESVFHLFIGCHFAISCWEPSSYSQCQALTLFRSSSSCKSKSTSLSSWRLLF